MKWFGKLSLVPGDGTRGISHHPPVVSDPTPLQGSECATNPRKVESPQDAVRADEPEEDDSRRFCLMVVAGETSGDQHAAGLITALRRRNPNWHLDGFGSGGVRLAELDWELLGDVSQLAAIGPWEALPQLRCYWKLYRQLLRTAHARRPNVAILVDFPEFNLRLARRLKAMGIFVCYFVSPQVWAWRTGRVRQIERYVDLMLLIFPFEVDFYRRHGVSAHYVGNPTAARLRNLASYSSSVVRSDELFRVGLLPGSRRKEVGHIFPIQLDAARYVAERFDVRFHVIQAPSLDSSYIPSLYRHWLACGNPKLALQIDRQEVTEILPRMDCAIIKSGTSTLEAMMLRVPFAMVYRMSPLSWYLARPLVGTRVYCLANLVAGRSVVPEFVQRDATGERIGGYLCQLLRDPAFRKKVRRKLADGSQKLGAGDAYEEAARWVEKYLFTGMSRGGKS